MDTFELVKRFIRRYPWLYNEMRSCDHHYNELNLNSYHMEGDIWAHTCMTLNTGEFLNKDENTRLALLLHDIGKPRAKEIIEGKKKCLFRGHEGISFWMAIKILKDFGISKERMILILSTISLHTDLFRFTEKPCIKKLRNIFGGDLELFQSVIEHAECDGSGRLYQKKEDEIDPMEIFDYFKPYFEEIDRKEKREDLSREIIILCGIPGAGKSTWVKNNSSGYTVVSLDDIIEELGSKEGLNYRESRRLKGEEAIKIFNRKLEKAVRNNENIIVDKTHMSKKSRNRSLGQVKKHYKKTCKLFITDLNTCLERTTTREEENGKHISYDVFTDLMKSFKVPSGDVFDQVDWIFDE